MAMRYVKIFFDWPEATSELSFEEKGRLIDAIVAYAAGEKYDLAGNERYVFPTFKIQIDRDTVAYDEISEKRRNASITRWNRDKANVSTCFDTNTKDCKCKQDHDEDKDKDHDHDESVIKSRKRSRFVPPTLQQVEEYISEQRLNIDGQRFISYYDANGWKVGRNPMQDWKAAMRYWSKQENGGTKFGRDAVARSDSATDAWETLDPERKRLFERAFEEGT